MNRVLDDIISNHPVGVVNMALFACEKKYYDLFRNLGVKTINFDAQTSCMLHIDYEPAIRDAMALLTRTGHKHPVYLAGLSKEIGQNDDRIKLYRKTVCEFGYEKFAEQVLFGDYPDRKAVAEGYPVTGYFHWSLLDNLEWHCGIRPRFGLAYVNFHTGARTLKLSGEYFREVLRKNQIP